MTQFIIIRPWAQQCWAEEFKDLREAELRAGLDPGHVDHGTVRDGLAIVVHEFSLLEPPETQSYFSIGDRLYAGCAVIYAYDGAGETIDAHLAYLPSDLTWYADAETAKLAIDHGLVEAPRIALNGVELWRWPNEVRR
jgi:hypothetical protein